MKYPLSSLPSKLNPVKFQMNRGFSCYVSAYFSVSLLSTSRYLFYGPTKSKAAYE